MINRDYENMQIIERESVSDSNRLQYALSVLDKQHSKTTSSASDYFSMESIDHALVIDDDISRYTSYESATPNTTKERLINWIRLALEKLIHISKTIYDYIAKCLTSIAKTLRHRRASRDHDAMFKEVAVKNKIKLSSVNKIESAFSKIRATDIRPLKIEGIPKIFQMTALKTVTDTHYTDSLYGYYTDSVMRNAVIEIQRKLVLWVRQSSASTKGFIKDIGIITNSDLKPGELLDRVTPLERYIPKQSDITINSSYTYYARRSKEKLQGRTIDDARECLKWISNDLQSGTHTRQMTKKSTQTLSEIDSMAPYLDTEVFAGNLENAAKDLKSLTDNKMHIFRTTGDLDIPGVTKLLEIDEHIRKYIFTVYQAVSIINIISHLENNHMLIKEAIYNQKLMILSGFRGMNME